MLAWLDKHQVTLYLLAIACGIVGGLLPVLPDAVEPVVLPALALLLWATFSSIPLVSQAKTQNIAKEEYKTRGYFTGWILAGNFLLVPAIVALLLWIIPTQSELRFAAALVLLAPCIDYVIVFTGIAGGAASQLLRNTPLLLLIQAVAVPVYLWAFHALGLWDVPGLSLEALYAFSNAHRCRTCRHRYSALCRLGNTKGRGSSCPPQPGTLRSHHGAAHDPGTF